MKILILEDSYNRIVQFKDKLSGPEFDLTIVDTAEQAIAAFQEEQFTVVFLDHDLGGQAPYYYGVNCDINDPNTGSEVVRWMLENEDIVGDPDVVIHSLNEPAAKDMELKLKKVFSFVYRLPFTVLKTYLPAVLRAE